MKNSITRLVTFPVIFLLLFTIIVMQNWQLISKNKNSVIYTYSRSFSQGHIGSGFGKAESVNVPFDKLEPGDIVLGGWPNCAYGKYSHAGLYLGNNEVLEAYVDYGVCIQPLEHYTEYTELSLLRVEASQAIKQQVISRARNYSGKMFYPLAFKDGERYWNCSKIIWKAYADQGIDLDINHDLWIAPESFRDDSNIIKIYEKEM